MATDWSPASGAGLSRARVVSKGSVCRRPAIRRGLRRARSRPAAAARRGGEDPDDVGTTFDLLVEPFQRIVDQIFFQCGTGKSAKAVMSLSAWRSHAHHRREKRAANDIDWPPSRCGKVSRYGEACQNSSSGFGRKLSLLSDSTLCGAEPVAGQHGSAEARQKLPIDGGERYRRGLAEGMPPMLDRRRHGLARSVNDHGVAPGVAAHRAGFVWSALRVTNDGAGQWDDRCR